MYYVLYGFLYLLSLLPLRVLYLLSDFAYLVIYHLMGYRKKVVLGNLAIAFPQKTESERQAIARKFYRNFTDTFIETIKFISASPAFINRHFKTDYTVFEELYAQDKKIQIHTGHNFNWELANLGVALNIPFTFLGVYQPIQNKAVNRIFMQMRSRTGTVLLPANDMRRSILAYRDQQYALGLIADQNPGDTRRGCYWVPFFGRPTPFVSGPENGARIGNIPVVFGHFTKKRRGYYEGHFFLAEADPASLPKGELTRRYIAYLEETITRDPEMWLWSHRRWKHQWKPEYGLLTAPQQDSIS
ncbi:lysophospholipid acyltransferase family protein [Pseudocnuella soli]|uniref:lysophospholipid acyltransferase family protein n=1 Tax=Pseudocnuella soli TaxID=2502779 RepID=UPI00105179BF|nr:lysophospholipid acyltransferase family protein [Pseudocnuella soli]